MQDAGDELLLLFCYHCYWYVTILIQKQKLRSHVCERSSHEAVTKTWKICKWSTREVSNRTLNLDSVPEEVRRTPSRLNRRNRTTAFLYAWQSTVERIPDWQNTDPGQISVAIRLYVELAKTAIDKLLKQSNGSKHDESLQKNYRRVVKREGYWYTAKLNQRNLSFGWCSIITERLTCVLFKTLTFLTNNVATDIDRIKSRETIGARTSTWCKWTCKLSSDTNMARCRQL